MGPDMDSETRTLPEAAPDTPWPHRQLLLPLSSVSSSPSSVLSHFTSPLSGLGFPARWHRSRQWDRGGSQVMLPPPASAGSSMCRGRRDLPPELATQTPQAQSDSLSSLPTGDLHSPPPPPPPPRTNPEISRGGPSAATHCALGECQPRRPRAVSPWAPVLLCLPPSPPHMHSPICPQFSPRPWGQFGPCCQSLLPRRVTEPSHQV